MDLNVLFFNLNFKTIIRFDTAILKLQWTANFILHFCLDQPSHFLRNSITFSYIRKHTKTFYTKQVVIELSLHQDLFSTKTVKFSFVS